MAERGTTVATATPVPSGTIDFGRSFTFPTEDPDWIKKILIGGAFSLLCGVLVGIPFVLGYMARLLRNVVAGQARPLPEWDDLGGIFGDGLNLAVVYLVYAVVVGVVLCVPFMLLWLPLMAIGGRAEAEPSAVLGIFSGLGALAMWGVLMLASIALAIYLPAALVRAALKGSVGEGFAFAPILAFIRANLQNYLLSIVAFLVAAFVAQFGVLLCCVGIFPATFWSHLVGVIALGQTVRLNSGSV
jgi:hypothetical protein